MKTCMAMYQLFRQGSIGLDIALGVGGIRGRIIEIYGPESSVRQL